MVRKILMGVGLCLIANTCALAGVADAPNGMKFPSDYKEWKTISVSHRVDNHTLRTILGNDIAIKAAREGNINPWPKGAMLGKVVWKEKVDENWDKAIVPGDIVHVEFMLKDDEKYKETGGWGYARWLGKEHKPYGQDASVVNECMACHTPVQKNDWVYTRPALFP